MGRGVAKVVQAKFDAKTLHERPAVAAEARMVDDGSGAKEVVSHNNSFPHSQNRDLTIKIVQVFRVENFDLVQVDEEDESNFYSGDCYVVLYAFNNGTRDNYMIYYWLVSWKGQKP